MQHLVFENETDFEVDLDLANTLCNEMAKSKEIELILTNNEKIHEINLTSRGIDKPTDVLSFPYVDMPNTPLGSIVISADFVDQKSKEYDHSFQDEFNLLFIHGFLHLLGYDHEVDNGEHRIKEEELIRKFNLPNSLIVRSS
ncbi:MAG: rRNA maturation RNase YbeY [Campylobacterales bacterium]|nr:rRNA maturation RNase YbeY [Campylobacterales bacterium]